MLAAAFYRSSDENKFKAPGSNKQIFNKNDIHKLLEKLFTEC
jgi:hypothetical protein